MHVFSFILLMTGLNLTEVIGLLPFLVSVSSIDKKKLRTLCISVSMPHSFFRSSISSYLTISLSLFFSVSFLHVSAPLSIFFLVPEILARLAYSHCLCNILHQCLIEIMHMHIHFYCLHLCSAPDKARGSHAFLPVML